MYTQLFADMYALISTLHCPNQARVLIQITQGKFNYENTFKIIHLIYDQSDNDRQSLGTR